MPDRLIRQSCRSSATLQALSPEAERLWWRLTTVADDHGLFDANPAMLASTCFPLWRALDVQEVERWLQEIVLVGGIALYHQEGKRYGIFVRWKEYQTPRGSKPKHPLPPADLCEQALTNASKREQKSPYSYSVVERRSTRVVRVAPSVAYTETGFVVPEILLARWVETFRPVDVPAQIRASFAWAEASPDRKRANWTRFVVNWLKREYDKIPKPPPPPEKARPALLDEAPPVVDEQVSADGLARLREMMDSSPVKALPS